MPVTGSDMAVLSITQGVTLFVTLLPDVSQMRKAGPDDAEFHADVRTSEGIAAALTLGTGLAVSVFSKSATPALVAIGTTALLVIVSELLLRKGSDAPILARKATP